MKVHANRARGFLFHHSEHEVDAIITVSHVGIESSEANYDLGELGRVGAGAIGEKRDRGCASSIG